MTPAEKLAKQLAGSGGGVRRNRGRQGHRWTVCHLRSLRDALGLSRREVALAVGLAPVSLVPIEQGHDVMLCTAVRLARFYGRSIEEIWVE